MIRRLYCKLRFFFSCQLWPYITGKTMWRMGPPNIVIDPEATFTLEAE